jgi:hypothetical protein
MIHEAYKKYKLTTTSDGTKKIRLIWLLLFKQKESECLML